MERREFLAAAAAAPFVAPRGSDYRDREHLKALSVSLERGRNALGGTPLVSSSLAHAVSALSAIDGNKDRATFAAAAELMSQIALVLYDAGRLPQARQIAAFELEFALCAGDPDRQAHAYDNLSRLSLYSGDHARGIRYARQGLRIPDLSPERRASLYMRLGRCLARTPGGECAARAALGTALEAHGLSPLDQATIAGDVGVGMIHLREHAEAQTLLGTAINRIGQASPLFHAQYLGRRIQAALRAGDLSLASEYMDRLSRALPLVTSGRVDRRVARILDATAAMNDPELRAARDRLLDVAATRRGKT